MVRFNLPLYTFWDMIGIVGGFYEVIKVTLSFVMNIYTSRLLSVDLLNSYNEKLKKNKFEHNSSDSNERSINYNRHRALRLDNQDDDEAKDESENEGNYSY